MALLSDLRGQVRRDLHDLLKPQEQSVDTDPALVTYNFPTFGPIQTASFKLDIDGVPKATPADYTLYESGFVVLSGLTTGQSLHATYQWARYSDADLNQFIQEAIREYSLVYPKQTRLRRNAQNLTSAKLTAPYTIGDAVLTVGSTAGYDSMGILQLGNVFYFYTGITATTFVLDPIGGGIWAGPDAAQPIGTTCILNDNNNHGWVYDPNKVRFVYKLEGFEPPDEFGVGAGFQEIAYFKFDESTGYVHVEFDFSQLETGNAQAIAPVFQFQVTTGQYYNVPVNDTDVLEIPDYALNPISWLAAALAAESREGDRDWAWKEGTGGDPTADPALTFQKVGAANRKKWNDWVAKQFRPFPRSRRRIYQL
jgi:hypothetical protein